MKREDALSPPVHLINPMTEVGGSELHTVDMWRVLSRYTRATVWSERPVDPQLAALAPVERIHLGKLHFPRQGVFLFVGAYFEVGAWWRFARPSRTLLLYNIDNPRRLEYALARLSLGGRRRVELIYASKRLKAEAGLPGVVEDSPIDLDRYQPARAVPRNEFVVGRASRDDPLKFSDDDPALFERLAAAGFHVRIAGGTCLRARIAPHPRIELLPVLSPLAMPHFMQGLDCFVYRTSPEWPESYGRVIAEAMACGVPPVVASNAGIAQHIRHGENGFIADTNEEVMDILLTLREDRELRARVGVAARRTMEERYGEEQLARIAAYYLRGEAGVPA
ncbi:MAG: glycosyltransferase [Burkholderiales bacterium]|nr:glycosyltransferase [Burkholderiales bacterium]